MSSVLYDVPGPRARLRNRVLGVVTILVVLALIGLTVWRLYATGQFTAQKWSIFGYTAIWMRILDGLWHTLSAFIVAGVGALILGFILAVGRLSDHAWIRVPVGWIVEILRAIPVLIFMMLMYYGLPTVGIKVTPYVAVVVALIAYNGSVLAEAIRAGVESLPRGQKEAGYAIGLRKNGVMRLILLPQAVRAMMPVIISQLVVALKDTALGFIITYPELLYVIKLLGTQIQYGSPLVPAAIVGGSIYVALCLLLSYVAYRVEKRMRRSPKAPHLDPGDGGDPTTATERIAVRRGLGKFDGRQA
ncbi:amino acid ABC transporter permease [Microbacterium horticulturae]|uniref:Amino acid ABC transporter permease n=1 Tax=Microbacterium horticulturae TaxID=3028316 RepID=A0ABY8BX39_9MICO|nr:amino acid ABC transporter permease [Microbacterium sp. KACC 23027]WEG07687.1 amino acid ABC transporter permease [Microbacterium sp. KACC 23027]